MLGKKKIAIISLILAYTIIVPVFAYMYFYRTESTYIAAGVVLQSYPTPNMTLGFYWDQECTQSVTFFDFGERIHPNQETILWKRIYIKNEGDVWNEIYWNSTLNDATTEITEWWATSRYWGGLDLNGTRIELGQVRETWYGIKIPAYATVGTYNWTLTLWGENYY